MAFHHTPVLPYDLDSRDARWPVDGGCFECVILIWVWVRTAKEDNHSPLWDKKFFFWISLSMGHKWWQHILIEKEIANKNEQFKAIATCMYLVGFIWQQTTFTQTQIE